MTRYNRIIGFACRPNATIERAAEIELEASLPHVSRASIRRRCRLDGPRRIARRRCSHRQLRSQPLAAARTSRWYLLLVTCLNVMTSCCAPMTRAARSCRTNHAGQKRSSSGSPAASRQTSVLACSGQEVRMLLASFSIECPQNKQHRLESSEAPTRSFSTASTLIVAASSALCAIVIFAMASRTRVHELAETLHAGSPGWGGARRGRAGSGALTLAQCAGAATLVILAVMLTRSFVNLMTVDLGWSAEGVLSMSVSPPRPQIDRPWYRYVEWSDRLIARLEATPGVQRAAITTQVPLGPQSYQSTLARGRGWAAHDARWLGVQHSVTDRYFELMGISNRQRPHVWRHRPVQRVAADGAASGGVGRGCREPEHRTKSLARRISHRQSALAARR